VIHTDLTPSNVFIRNDGVVKLGGFGKSVTYKSVKTINKQLVHLTPEAIITDKSDIYSLGCLIQ